MPYQSTRLFWNAIIALVPAYCGEGCSRSFHALVAVFTMKAAHVWHVWLFAVVLWLENLNIHVPHNFWGESTTRVQV